MKENHTMPNETQTEESMIEVGPRLAKRIGKLENQGMSSGDAYREVISANEQFKAAYLAWICE